jgi:hypothetical protein
VYSFNLKLWFLSSRNIIINLDSSFGRTWEKTDYTREAGGIRSWGNRSQVWEGKKERVLGG